MKVHTDRNQENKSRDSSAEGLRKQVGVQSLPLITDNRQRVTTHMKLQKEINNSPRALQLMAIQEMANNSPRVRQMKALQELTNDKEIKPERDTIQKVAYQHINNRIITKNHLPNNGKAVIQRVSDEEKESFERQWEAIESELDRMYAHDPEATLPIVKQLEEIRLIIGKSADKIDGDELQAHIHQVRLWMGKGRRERASGIQDGLQHGRSSRSTGSSRMAEMVSREREERRSAPLSAKLAHHIFLGEINSDGDPTGFHSKQREGEAVLEAFGPKTPVGSKGVYHQAVRIKGGGKVKGPGSTFFPDGMTEDEIRIAINMHSGYTVIEPARFMGMRLEKKGDTIYPIG